MDVKVETVIERPRLEVARYAMDPANDPLWIGGVEEARPLTSGPIAVGSRVARVAKFMGRRIDYVLEVLEHQPTGVLVMRSIEAPFPMLVTYGFADAVGGGTVVRIRVEGEPDGWMRFGGRLSSFMVKRKVRGDLKRLKGLLEVAEGEAGGASPW